MGVYRWEPEWEDALKEYWGLYYPAEIARKMTKRFEHLFTETSVKRKASRLGLNVRTAQGDMTLTDAAKAIGTDHWVLTRAMARMGLKAYGKGRHRYIRQADYEKIANHLALPPEPCVKAGEAAEILHCSIYAIRDMIGRGELIGYKCRRHWWVSKKSLDKYRYRHGLMFIGVKQVITPQEAGRRLGYGANMVYHLIKTGRLVADRKGHCWEVDAFSVWQYGQKSGRVHGGISVPMPRQLVRA